jgi:hypothetical protein
MRDWGVHSPMRRVSTSYVEVLIASSIPKYPNGALVFLLYQYHWTVVVFATPDNEVNDGKDRCTSVHCRAPIHVCTEQLYVSFRSRSFSGQALCLYIQGRMVDQGKECEYINHDQEQDCSNIQRQASCTETPACGWQRLVFPNLAKRNTADGDDVGA